MERSNTEIALEFLEGNEELTTQLQQEAFQAFWENPLEVIQLYEAMLGFLKNSQQVAQETIDAMRVEMLSDACLNVNLMAKEAK